MQCSHAFIVLYVEEACFSVGKIITSRVSILGGFRMLMKTPLEFPRYLPLAIELVNDRKICVANLCLLVALWLLPVPGKARGAVSV